VKLWVVYQDRGGPWDWSRDMREQARWDEHARFMDDLVETGFVVLGGPLAGGRRVLLIVSAEDEAALRARFADDPWIANGMLTISHVEPWTVLLDGPTRSPPRRRPRARRTQFG
jgi:uncharacterized protein YciI